MRQDLEPFSARDLVKFLEASGARQFRSPSSGSAHQTYELPNGRRVGVPRTAAGKVTRLTGERLARELEMSHAELLQALGYQPGCGSHGRSRPVVARVASRSFPTAAEAALIERLELACKEALISGVRSSEARHLRAVILRALEPLEEMVRA